MVQFSEEISVQLAPKDAVEINEEKIDRYVIIHFSYILLQHNTDFMYVFHACRLRHLLHEANPEEDRYDAPEMLDLEGISHISF